MLARYGARGSLSWGKQLEASQSSVLCDSALDDVEVLIGVERLFCQCLLEQMGEQFLKRPTTHLLVRPNISIPIDNYKLKN